MKSLITDIAVKLQLTTSARLKIVKYLFETLSPNDNVLHITIRELSKVLHVGTNVVTFTLKRLEEEDIIKRGSGMIMLHVDILNRWQNESHTHPDPHGVNINIQMDQACYGHEPRSKRETRHETREEKREKAFAALSRRQDDHRFESSERENALSRREAACDLREAALAEKERTLRQWEKRLDAVLGLDSTERTESIWS